MHCRCWMVIYLQQLCKYYLSFCLRLQVRAPVQTEVAAVHRRQQHRVALPHGSQPLAGGPHGNDPDRSGLLFDTLQLPHIFIDACWITAPSVGTLKNWIFNHFTCCIRVRVMFYVSTASSSCFLSGGGEKRHMFMDSCARMQKKTLCVNTARLCDVTQIYKNWCGFYLPFINYSVTR